MFGMVMSVLEFRWTNAILVKANQALKKSQRQCDFAKSIAHPNLKMRS